MTPEQFVALGDFLERLQGLGAVQVAVGDVQVVFIPKDDSGLDDLLGAPLVARTPPVTDPEGWDSQDADEDDQAYLFTDKKS